MSDSRERFEAMTDNDRMCLANRFSIINVETRTFTIPQLHEFAKQIERDALERAAKVCEWKQDTDYETAIWHTSCGEAFVFNDGGPEENFLKFCCYCGGRLTAIRALAGKE